MKPNSILRVSRSFLTCALAWAIAASVLHAQNGEELDCSNLLLKGWYSFSADGIEAVPFGGFPGAVVGTFYADGDGRLTAFQLKEVVHTPPDFAGFLVLERDPIAEGIVPHIDYTVAPNCTGVISWTDQNSFDQDVPTELPFVLADGGRQGWALRTKVPSTLLLTFKRMTALDEQAEGQLSTLEAELAFVKSLVRRLAGAHGVLKQGE